ncbi:ZIP family metal transporter [Bacillus marasmi]|uniref:ZIP family metal transporter n=1 Tax=Bacillus marasmi TaxID=1926279 RepID=UPI00164E35B0|nr:ZIP family metal transporter [Bacillus marasmi]
MIWIYIFVGIIVGGLAVVLLTKMMKQNYLLLIVFCGGILAGLLGFELIPDLIGKYQPVGIFIGITLGFMFMLLIDRYLHQHPKIVHIEHHETFTLLFLALFIHSIPTGFALGLNFTHHHFQDPSLFGAIILHHIPEGMVMMVSVLYSKMKLKSFLIFGSLLSLAVSLNIYFGITFDVNSIQLRTIIMGIAIGSLGYVTFFEILWKGLKNHLTLKMVMSACLGLIFIKLYFVFVSFGH